MHPGKNSGRFTAGMMERPLMRQKFATSLAVLLLVGAGPLLSGCYTTAGAGKDLQAAGHGITHSAQENTTYRP
jgi:predicted small secreted protein